MSRLLRRSISRRAALVFICILSVGILAASAEAATVSWAVDADGDWNVGTNWSGGVVPTASDTVLIDRGAGLYTITVPTGTHAAFSIFSNENLVLDAGTLTVSDTIQVNAEFRLEGTILVGSVVMPGSGGEGVDAVSGTLDGVVMNADLDISGPSSRTITLKNGLTLNGTATMGDEGSSFGRFLISGAQTLDGTGEIILGDASTANGITPTSGGDLVIESGLTIHGASGGIGSANFDLVLKAPVTAEVSGRQIYIQGDTLFVQAPITAVNGANLRLGDTPVIQAKTSISGGGTLRIDGNSANQDTVEVGTGCSLDLNGTWTNQGAIRLTDAATTLGGNFAFADVGDFVRTGGTVKIDGILENTGHALTLNANTGSWELAGGTILEGSVETGLAGSELTYTSGTLDGVVMNADMDLSESFSISLTVKNGLTLNGTATMGDEGSAFGRFLISGAQTLDGTGEIILGDASTANGITPTSGGNLVIESGLTIHGASGSIGSANLDLVLKAPVTAEVSGRQIYIQGDTLFVQAPITAVNGANLRLGDTPVIQAKTSISGGGTLRIDGNWTNQDTLEVGTGCSLDLNGTWTNQGAIRLTDAATTLGGNFAFADVGDFVRTGGTVKIDGILENTGHALTLNANTGSWELAGGTILEGSVETGLAGSELTYTSGTLDGVVMNADMDLSESFSISLTVKNGLTLNGTATMGDEGSAFGRFLISGAQTLDGTGEIILGDASSANGITPTSGGNLVIESGLTIHGASGSIGSANLDLVLKAPVTAEVSGRQIYIQGDTLFVQAPITAVNGANLRLGDTPVIQAKTSISGGGTLRIDGNWTNQDTLEVGTGCSLDLNGTWTNQGAIRLTDAATTLGGNFAFADVGDFVRTGGTVKIDGILENAGHALTLNANTGSWELAGGTILEGSVETGLAGSELTYTSGTLDGVVMNADMDLSESFSISLTVKNGLTLNGTATMGDEGSAFGRFLISGAQTLDGTGEIILGDASSANGITPTSGGNLVIESGLTIHGASGSIGSANLDLVLKAPVTAEVSGRQIYIQGDTLFVQAPITAVNGANLRLGDTPVIQAKTSISGGGTLRIDGNWTNQDTLEVGTGCSLDLNGTWTNQGAIRLTDAATTLGGNFAFADVGDFVRTGGTVKIDGILENAGHALTLNANTGSWELAGGTILEGSVETGLAGSELTYTSGTLDGVVMNADMDLSESFSISLTVKNGLTLNGTATMGDEGSAFGRFLISGAQTLDGTGEIILGDASSANGITPTSGGNLVIESGLTIHGASGSIGSASLTMMNRGTVSADSAGHAIRLQGSSWTNEGTVIATLGTINNSAPFVTSDSVRVDSLGTFSGSGTFLQTAGSTRIADGGLLDQSTVTIQDGTFTCGGTVDGELSMSAGTIAPGTSPGVLTGTGGYTQTGGTVEVEIAGADPSDYDRMTFPGVAALAGTLDVSFLDAFMPTLYDTFTVMNYASKTDSFDVVNLPVLDPSLCWLVEQASDEIRLIAEVNPAPVAMCIDTTLIANLSCEGTVTAEALTSGTFDPKGETFTLSLDPPSPYPIGVNVVNFIAIDSRGAADTCITTITVINSAPVAASHDTTLIAVTGTCDATVTAAELDNGTADAEGHSFTLALSPAGPYPLGVNVVDFIATDQCGFADTTQTTITVINNEPVAVCIDTTIAVDNSECVGTLVPADLDGGSSDPDGHTFTLALDPPGPYPIGVNVVDFIVTDECGLADTCVSTITVVNDAPIVACLDTTIVVDNGTCVGSITAAAIDNGTLDPNGNGFTLALDPPGPYSLGANIVNFIATDDCGAADTCVSTITVINTDPVAVCRDTTISVGADCTGALTAADLDDGSFDPNGNGITLAIEPAGPFAIGATQVNFIVIDDCGAADTCVSMVTVINTAPVAACKDTTVVGEPVTCIASLTGADLDDGTIDPEGNALTFSLEPPGPFGIGTTQVNFIATDACGLADTCVANITVISNAPVAACQNITIPVDNGTCVGSTTAAAVDNGTTEPDGDPFTMILDPPGPYALGANLVNFIATDTCGFADTCMATITVVSTPPVAACLDTTISVDNAACVGSITAAALDNGTIDPDGNGFTLALDPPGPYAIGVNVVNFIATDDCGAADTCVSTVTVVNDAPVAACQNVVIPVDGGTCVGSITAAALDNGTSDPNGNGFTLAIEPAGPFAVGVHPVNFIATDDCGAADTCVSMVTVVNDAPIAACVDTTISVENGTCEGAITAAALDGGTADPNGNGFTLALDPPGPYALGAHVVNFIATDDCGAADTCVSTITVINNAPVVACRDTTILAEPITCIANVVPSDLDDGTVDPDGNNFTLSLVPPGPFAMGTHQVSLIATDDCGAADTCTATVTVISTPPVAACKDTTVAVDNSSCVATLTAADLDDGTTEPDGEPFVLALEPPGPFPIGITQVNFIATDTCGSADTCMAMITVINSPPIAACFDTTLLADSTSCEATLTAAAIDNGTVDSNGNGFTLALDPAGPYGIGNHQVNFIATDDCGAADTCVATVVVTSNRPTAVAIAEIVVQSDSASCMASVVASAFDGGSSDGEVTNLLFSLEPEGPYPLGVTNLKLIVSDGCESDTADTRIVVECTQVGTPDTPMPVVFNVASATPNPFRGATRIQLDLPEARHVRAQVFDVSGRMISVLANETMSAGRWELAWNGQGDDGRNLSAGVYLVRVQAGKDVVVRKALLVQ